MPIIVPHQSNQAISNASGGQSTPYQNPSAFLSQGQSMANGMATLSQGFNNLGNVLLEEEVKKRKEQMELDLMEDMQNFHSESKKWTDTYRQENQGKNALNAEEDTTAYLKNNLQILHEKWKGNKEAEAFIQKNAGSLIISEIGSMRDFSYKQQEAWKDSIFEGEKTTYKSILSNPNSTFSEIGEASRKFDESYTNYLSSKGLDTNSAKVVVEDIHREAVGKKVENSFIDSINNQDFDKASSFLDIMKNGSAADFSSINESGILGSHAIGYDKKGGTSYGKFQISSKAGTFDTWLTWLDKNGYKNVSNQLRSAGSADTGSNQGKMPEIWSALVDSGEITDEMQTKFIQESHIEPALNRLPENIKENILSDPRLYRAFFSTAVQHGSNGTTRLFTESWKQASGNKDDFIHLLYEKRKKEFTSSTPEIQESVNARLTREKNSLNISIANPETIAKYTTALEKAKTEHLVNTTVEKLKDLPFSEGLSYVMESEELRNNAKAMEVVTRQLEFFSRQKEKLAEHESYFIAQEACSNIDKAYNSKDYQKINQIIASAPVTIRGSLTKYAENLDSDVGVSISDPDKYNEATEAILNGKQFNPLDWVDYLTPKDIKKLQTTFESADLKEYKLNEIANFRSRALEYDNSLTPTDINSLYKQFEASIPRGGYENVEIRKKAFKDFFTPHEVIPTHWWNSDRSMTLFDMKREKFEHLPKDKKTYKKLYDVVQGELVKRGVSRKPTEDELLRAFKQMNEDKRFN